MGQILTTDSSTCVEMSMLDEPENIGRQLERHLSFLALTAAMVILHDSLRENLLFIQMASDQPENFNKYGSQVCKVQTGDFDDNTSSSTAVWV